MSDADWMFERPTTPHQRCLPAFGIGAEFYEVTSAKGEFLANVAQVRAGRARRGHRRTRRAGEVWNATAYNRGQVLYRLAEMAESRRDELAEHVALSEGVNARTSQKSSRVIIAWSGTPVGPTRSPVLGGRIRRRTVLQLFDPGAEWCRCVVCVQESSLEDSWTPSWLRCASATRSSRSPVNPSTPAVLLGR